VAMLPASVNKVLTAAVALRVLGPGHKFNTLITTDAKITAGGTLQGDLYVRGFGDPTLVYEKLHRLVADLPLMGIDKIQGDVVFDDTYFDQDWLIPGWRKGTDLRQGPAYFAPITALGVNFSSICIVVAPALTVGGTARVEFESPIPMLSLESSVVTGALRSGTKVQILRKVTGDKVHFKLSGAIAQGVAPSKYYRAIAEPRPFFRQMFQLAMKERGVTVTGKYRHGRAPKSARLVTKMESLSLGVIVGRMNKHSSNYMAETLLKAVGAESAGRPGTSAKGLIALGKMLQTMGNEAGSYKLVNGSGLSREIMLSPSLINGLMVQMYHDRRVGPEFISSMSIGGEDGTLWPRFRQVDRRGRLRGKTGSLSGVYSLTAYVDGGDGEVYVMTFMTNGIKGSSRKVRNLQDRFAGKLLDLEAP